MRIDMDQTHGTVLATHGPKDRQRDGMIATQRERYAIRTQHLLERPLNDLDTLGEIEGVDRHIPDIGHLHAVEGSGTGPHVVRPDQTRLGPDLSRRESRT